MTAAQGQNKIALDAKGLEAACKANIHPDTEPSDTERAKMANSIRAYLAALASPAQEPVAWMHPIGAIWRADNCPAGIDFTQDGWIPLGVIAAPPAPAPAQVAVKALEWHAHDLIPGRAYESQNWGTVKYAGLDTYHGETTHEFRGSMTCGGARYIKSEKLGDFLKPKLAALALAEGQATEGWQPMETAPKDGGEIDLWCFWPEKEEHRRSPDARWVNGDWKLDGFSRHQYAYPPVPMFWMRPALPAVQS